MKSVHVIDPSIPCYIYISVSKRSVLHEIETHLRVKETHSCVKEISFHVKETSIPFYTYIGITVCLRVIIHT